MLPLRETVGGPVLSREASLTLTVVSTESVSSAGVTVSGLMVAVLVIWPVWMALTPMVATLEVLRGVMVPMLQVTTLLPASKLQEAGLTAVAPSEGVPAGIGSLRVALSKLTVPVFFSVTP